MKYLTKTEEQLWNGLQTTFSSVLQIIHINCYFMTPYLEHIQCINKNIIIKYSTLGLDYQQVYFIYS